MKILKDLRINICYNFQSDAWGGGNQFLKTLKKDFLKKEIYEKNPNKANCIIFNSHHLLKKILSLKYLNPNIIFIQRVDGPLYIARGRNLEIDLKIYELNNLIVDGTIFQSEWSKRENSLLGLKKNSFQTVIMNASDNEIFFPNPEKIFNLKKMDKIKLVAVSWSTNYNKGFDLYKFLDENLDYNQYSIKFIGNSPIKFKNIEMIKPVRTDKLAIFLRESDIYISGSKYECCSNSLIEALSCGLPGIVLKIESSSAILKNGGEYFTTFEEFLKKIQLVRENYDTYRKNIQAPNIEAISELYINFILKILQLKKSKKYKCKRLRKIDYYKFKLKYNLFENQKKKIINKSYRLISTIMIRMLRKSKKKLLNFFILMRLTSSKKNNSALPK